MRERFSRCIISRYFLRVDSKGFGGGVLAGENRGGRGKAEGEIALHSVYNFSQRLCVCIYVCVYACKYVCIYVYVCMYVCLSGMCMLCMHGWAHACNHVCIFVCI